MTSLAAVSSSPAAGNGRSVAGLAQALERANDLVERLRARAADVDAKRRIPDESIAEINDAGLFRISAPRMFGGSQLGISPLIQTVATIASGCGSTGWVYASGEADIPQHQICYFLMNVDGAQRDLRVNIGEDGRQLAPKRRVPNVNFNDAYRLCTWFSAT